MNNFIKTDGLLIIQPEKSVVDHIIGEIDK